MTGRTSRTMSGRYAGARRRVGPLRGQRRPVRLAAQIAAAGVVVAAMAGIALALLDAPAPQGEALPATPGSYLGVYVRGVPASYAPVDAFTAAAGVTPNLAIYYSGWGEQFYGSFARQAAGHGAVPVVQINPTHVSVAAIAGGGYDRYLTKYAAAVRSYPGPVILSFGHEMNGWWSSWGYRHTSPAVFVAAWRHIVTLFRHQKVHNVTWLWTINIIDRRGGIASPGPWWPGSRYVTWVGIDGYYYKPSWTFASLFGPTIKAVRALTREPILIAETGAVPAAGQPAKIANLFGGIRAYGLLGFVWFDAKDWRLTSRAAIAAFRQQAVQHHPS